MDSQPSTLAGSSSGPKKFPWKTIADWIDSGKLPIWRLQRHIDYLDKSVLCLHLISKHCVNVMPYTRKQNIPVKNKDLESARVLGNRCRRVLECYERDRMRTVEEDQRIVSDGK